MLFCENNHPFHQPTPYVCGGRIRIDGTRITVHRIAVLYKQGQTAEGIARTYPHLALDQVYTALAYYHANRAQIDADLVTDEAEYDKLQQQSTRSALSTATKVDTRATFGKPWKIQAKGQEPFC